MATIIKYSLDDIKNEARHLVEIGKLDIHDSIQVLCKFIPPREWICAESELEKSDYFLRDHICDLLTHEEWSED